MRVGIFGRGRLGTAIAQELAAGPEFELAWHIDKGEEPSGPVDLAFDASAAEAVSGHVDWALAAGADLVVAVTGWSLPDLAARVEGRIGLLAAPNFSLAVALMARLSLVLGRFAALDPDLDPFLTDHHHRHDRLDPGRRRPGAAQHRRGAGRGRVRRPHGGPGRPGGSAGTDPPGPVPGGVRPGRAAGGPLGARPQGPVQLRCLRP